MKKIITYFAALTAILLAASCTRENMAVPSESEGLAIRLVWSEMNTRAFPAGVDNEYKVENLDFYFFQDTTTTPVFHYSVSDPEFTAQSATLDGTYTLDFIPGTTYGETAFPAKNDLLRSDGYCTVYVVANLANAPEEPESLAKLKETAVAATFVNNKTAIAPDNDSFKLVMTGQNDKVKGTLTPVASATPVVIELNRLAAKFTLDVTVTPKTINGEVWEPMLNAENVRMYLQNAVSNAVLGAVDKQLPSQMTFFDYNPTFVSSDVDGTWTEGTGNYTATDIGPFYTYPNIWEMGKTDTFIKIVLPWKVTKTTGATVQREVYYKVVLTDPQVLSNYWYKLDITLEPGQEGEEDEVTVTAKYRVADWTTGGETGISGVLSDIKYLVVDYSDANADKNFVFYGQTMNVPYSASDAVSIKVMDAHIYDYSNTTVGTIEFAGWRDGATAGWFTQSSTKKKIGTLNGSTWSAVNAYGTVAGWFTASNGLLTINHALNNTLPSYGATSTYFDLSPYYFTVKIYLTRDESVCKYVNFIQYPQTTVTVDANTKGNVNNYSTSVFVNGNYYGNSGNSRNNYNYVTTLDNGENNNPNMYVISTSVLSDNTKKLGDPRTTTVSNGPKQSISWSSAPALSGTTPRVLTYYYPADEAKNDAFIAPKVRVASSYGRRSKPDNSWASCWDRCASYQEDGYPAGRWRLPTQAELIYFNTLSSVELIPSLFAGGKSYWTGKSGVTVNNGTVNTSSDSGTVRCVYDEWYWGSERALTDLTVFTWGDKSL